MLSIDNLFRISVLLLTLLSAPSLRSVHAFPAYESLAGLSQRELDEILPRLHAATPPTPPGPLQDTSAKLVYDKAHPWKPLRPGNIRGPCPGLNTLASHGWLPRNGVATPSQIISAVQDGFNMDHGTALFVTYAAMLVDGNVITDLLSIGGKTRKTGPDPAGPATVAGLNTHAVFEGDASMTRGDAFFGDNHSFNQTLFDQASFKDYSNRFGGGFYNLTVAGEFRWKRIQDSIATNPTFSFIAPRYFTAYAESTFPINFFVDGRKADGQLDMKAAESFFKDMRFPDDFFRAPKPVSAEGAEVVLNAHPLQPGGNVGRVNNYVLDPTSADSSTPCLLYTNFVNKTVRGLYPNPTGILRRNLNKNLDYFFEGIENDGCTKIFPYGKD